MIHHCRRVVNGMRRSPLGTRASSSRQTGELLILFPSVDGCLCRGLIA